MPIPTTQMFTNRLNPLKGWPSPYALDYVAYPAPGVDIKPGSCCSLNNQGQLVLGARRHHMPLFVIQGTQSHDVVRVHTTVWHTVTPSGKINCLVATGAYELQTTEFDSTQTYNFNDPLRTLADGRLTNQGVVLASQTNTPNTNSTAVVGIVSQPVMRDATGSMVLSFWPVWYPGRATE